MHNTQLHNTQYTIPEQSKPLDNPQSIIQYTICRSTENNGKDVYTTSIDRMNQIQETIQNCDDRVAVPLFYYTYRTQGF